MPWVPYRVVFTATGQVIGRSDYLPFGDTQEQSGALPRQRFTGQERDGEAGMDYFNARNLQPRTGRMNAPDPLFSAAVFNPQAWNRYSYVGNSPLVYTDPTGAFWDWISNLFHVNRNDVSVLGNDVYRVYPTPVYRSGTATEYSVVGPAANTGIAWPSGGAGSGGRGAGNEGGGGGGGGQPPPPPAEKKKSPPDTRLIEAAPLSTESCGSRYWGVTGSAGLLAGRSWSLAIPFLSRANVVSKTDTYGPFASLGGGVERVFVLDWAGHNGVGSEISAGFGPVGVTLSFNNGAHLNAVGISLGWSLLAGSLWVGPTTTTISCR